MLIKFIKELQIFFMKLLKITLMEIKILNIKIYFNQYLEKKNQYIYI